MNINGKIVVFDEQGNYYEPTPEEMEKLKDKIAVNNLPENKERILKERAGQGGKFMTMAQIKKIFYDGFNQAHYSHLHPDQFPPKEIEQVAADYFNGLTIDEQTER